MEFAMQERSKPLRGMLAGALLFGLAGCVVSPGYNSAPSGSYYAASPYYANNGYYGGDYATAIIVGGGGCCRDFHGHPPPGWHGPPHRPGGFHGGPSPGGFHGAPPNGGLHGGFGGTRPK